jgi:hypothetical protein
MDRVPDSLLVLAIVDALLLQTETNCQEILTRARDVEHGGAPA